MEEENSTYVHNLTHPISFPNIQTKRELKKFLFFFSPNLDFLFFTFL